MKLRWLRGFTSVDLSDNSLDDACGQPLKNLLALRQMRRLDLRGNDLGPSAGKALLETLPRCRNLQVLVEGDSVRQTYICSFACLIVGHSSRYQWAIAYEIPAEVLFWQSAGTTAVFANNFQHHVSSSKKREKRTQKCPLTARQPGSVSDIQLLCPNHPPQCFPRNVHNGFTSHSNDFSASSSLFLHDARSSVSSLTSSSPARRAQELLSRGG